MELLIDIASESEHINTERLNALCEFLCVELKLPEATEVSLSFVEDEEIKDLNSQYRDKDCVTDVLSFECDGLADDFPLDCSSVHTLGDIVIATNYALNQAAEHGNSQIEEIDLLFTHGFLHLCGYDHIKDEDAEVMEPIQDQLLDKWRNIAPAK